MNLIHYYWYFKSIIPERICNDIVKYGHQMQDQMAVTGGYENKKLDKKQVKDLKKKRDSNVVWMSDKWIYREIQPYIHEANRNAGWNFEWDFSEACQFTKYKKGQFYDWHCDALKKNESKIRKLSMTCQLTDPSEYKGGELEFDFRLYNPIKRDESRHVVTEKKALSKGSIIVFPSFTWHRVKPVQKGTRYSLVVWCRGEKFK